MSHAYYFLLENNIQKDDKPIVEKKYETPNTNVLTENDNLPDSTVDDENLQKVITIKFSIKIINK